MFNTTNNYQNSKGFISTISTGNKKGSVDKDLVKTVIGVGLPILVKGITDIAKIIIESRKD